MENAADSGGYIDARKRCRSDVTHLKLRGKLQKQNENARLSDINDAEIDKYLNTKDEIHLKKLLWEVLNRKKPAHAKKRKRTADTMKGGPVVKKNTEMEKRSSMVDYDALRLLEEELKNIPEESPKPEGASRNEETENPVHDDVFFDF